MITLITRFWWITVTLIALTGVTFLALYFHAANGVQTAAKAASHVAVITADTAALQQAVTTALEASLPVEENGQVLFDPATDITVTPIDANQEAQVAVTYHLPVLGPLQTLFGFSPTMPITRTSVQTLDYPHNNLHAVVTTSSPAPIEIQGVTLNASGGNVALAISGYGFGTAPAGVPGTTLGSFFSFQDVTQGWQAGATLSGIPVTYGSWSDTQIAISEIQDYGKGTETIQPGDNCQVTVTSSNGPATYSFVANPAGTTQYAATITASATSVSVTTPITLTATSSIPGDGTNGIGLYDESTGAYLMWSGSGETVAQTVNSGVATAQDYAAYYGPQGQISEALATSDNVSVTWWLGTNTTKVTALMYQNGSSEYVTVYGANLTGATINGTGLSGSSQVSANQIQATAANATDTSGEVTLADGTQIPFTAAVAY